MFKGNRKRQKLLGRFGKLKSDYFQMGQIRSYSDKLDSKGRKVLNERTWTDLDMDELYMFLDRCCSSIGQQLLYARLKGKAAIKSVIEWEALVERFQKDQTLRENAVVELDQLNDGDAYDLQGLFHEPYLSKPKWYVAIQIMSAVAFLSIPAALFVAKLWLIFFLILAVNLALHYWNKRNLFLYSRSMPYLLSLITVADKLKNWQSDKRPGLIESIEQLKELSGSLTIFKLEKSMQSEMAQFAELFVELIKAYFLLEPITLFKTLKKLEERKAHIQHLFEYVAEVDLALSVGVLREEMETWCPPEFTDNSTLQIQSIYHPLIPNSVRNDLSLTDRSLLLTGSNMSGKTTFIRTVGISAVCGRALNTCFCEHYEAPAFHVSSAIRISDDLLTDKSYFQEEMLAVRALLQEADSGPDHLFLLDELMKGTNTLERVAAGKAILDRLNSTGNLVMVATHDLELADLLKDQYELYHFSEVIEEDNIQFDYLLKPGKLTNTNAIRILEINQYPAELTVEARRLVEQMQRDKP